ncbi:thiamine phosphate synthase [Sediminitomix flava]|uniref:Thiamine-phosphate synthase n=1 Tax=Sediminitomix flava TaxID=379075 RepID=A0A315Z8X9_SEDFL|nr:thiamine phosphate synthase [Sediminitomix flava]PWJ41015.1 thiamine-phosphate diphosphorylase [Sediminitomix flava]
MIYVETRHALSLRLSSFRIFQSMEIAKLHFITQALPNLSHAEQTKLACEGGAEWVQVRVKDTDYDTWKSIAKECLEVCHQYGAKLCVNDNAQIAKEIGADSLHLGKTDMSPVEARALVGEGVVIGGTANDYEDVQRLAAAKVDYIGLGPFRFTTTKKNLSPILGLEGYQELLEKAKAEGIQIPIVGIGGIELEDIPSLLGTGLHGVALSSLISKAENPVLATQQILAKLN